ncbi:MDR family MFS transporter [Paenibacillus sp. VCA1]|uniref:MDR family MFS transporter n=1 Tax=Paenibacillus sp. VCA1 TaxID=3039148 RepID=UPI00287186DB|nr:MDR family MFS transporter [Paenibacillus sp. VCA1]MDR9853330.1 MDR family MFS transporter [Paenibacillus sp. VCA1]
MAAVKKNRLGFIVAGLLLGILISAIDNTIVATAMGTMIGDLGGLDQFVWVTSAYMVAEMAGMPIFGKLSDMYGRKRFFIFGIVIFLIGSMLCGTAHSITELSIYRAIQGIGGGALIPITFTIIFDIFPPEQRGKMSGMFGAVFGIANLFGPLMGAYITDYWHWRWIFYINVPLGLIAFFLVVFFYRESHEHSRQKIDVWGAATLIGSVVSLMFALELGGSKYAWDSFAIIGLFAAFAVLFIVFLLIERKAAEPIISYDMFRKRLFAASSAAALFYGAAFITAAVYIPIFVQGVMGGSATNSGLILLPLTLSSVVASQVGGMLSAKMTFRRIMVFSAVVFLLGMYLLATITPDTSRTLLTLYMIITGFGIGFSFSVLSMSAIQGMEARQRGSANSTISFLRSLGMTIGITIFGIIQRNDFKSQLTEKLGDAGKAMPASADPQHLLSPETRALIPQPVMEKISAALSLSVDHAFLWALLPVFFALVSVSMMGAGRMQFAKGPSPASSKSKA